MVRNVLSLFPVISVKCKFVAFEVNPPVLCVIIKTHHFCLKFKKKKQQTSQVSFLDGKKHSLRSLNMWAYECCVLADFLVRKASGITCVYTKDHPLGWWSAGDAFCEHCVGILCSGVFAYYKKRASLDPSSGVQNQS